MRASRRIVPLDGTDDVSGTEVGFKAARLAELRQLGVPVPEAWAITVPAFEEFCAANGIRMCDEPTPVSAQRIRTGTLPAALDDELTECLDALPAGTYAVRSSAVAEDGTSFSMAGQFETYLSVPKEHVRDRVRACWAAALSQTVMAYATKNRIARADRMGVIIQRQIEARHSGVLFTLDPVTKSADHFVVEWVEGPGEALVSGSVTPERIYLNRRNPIIPREVPRALRSDLARLAHYAALVERHFNGPVDIEWCADATGMFLVQARPVTAVTAGSAVAWTSTNMSENFPKPLTPFAWSVVDEFYTRYMQNLTRLLGIRDPELHRRRSPINRLTGAQGGRVYYNIKSWYELLQIYVPSFGGVFRRYLDHYIGQSVPIALDREESDATALRFATGVRYRISFWSRLVFHLSRGRHYLNRFERMFLDYRTALRQPPYHTLDPAALIEKLDALFEDFVARHWYHQCVADFSVLLFPGILDALVDRWIPNRRDDPGRMSARLLQRISVPSTDSAVIIQRLSRAVGECETLQGLLERRRYAALEEALPPSPKKLFTEFMERFGSRCYHECMIVSPTFEERTDLFWELVEKYQRLDRSRHAEARDKVSDTEAEDERARILQTVPVGKRQLVRLALGRAQRAIALREQGRMVQSLLFGEVRRLALALGEKLVELGHVRAADDVFFLSLSEVRDLCYGKFLLPETAPRLVAMRREALERCDRFEPPECFVLPEGVYFDHHARTSTVQDERTLRGVSASAGRACGTAKVILDPVVDKQLEPGDILVARSTDPGWTPLFMIAGGLVLERGGILSHGAIVAREFGIPAVVGVEGATKRIREGDAVSVDGDRGEVTTLDDGVPIRTDGGHARCGEDRKSA